MSRPITRGHETLDDSPDGRYVTVARISWTGSDYREVTLDQTRGGTLFVDPVKLRTLALALTEAADWLDGHMDDEEAES